MRVRQVFLSRRIIVLGMSSRIAMHHTGIGSEPGTVPDRNILTIRLIGMYTMHARILLSIDGYV